MENKKDFFKGDAENVYEYWLKKYETHSITDKDTAKFLNMLYKNEEGRANSSLYLNLMAKDIMDSKNSYKSINGFEDDELIKGVFKNLEDLENGNYLKKYLTNIKMYSCLENFKKDGEKDIEKINNGSLNVSNGGVDFILNAIIKLKDLIKKDPEASNLLDKFLLNKEFKEEYEMVDQRAKDLKELKNNIKDNHFIDWVNDMNKFYGIDCFKEIPAGNDIKSVDYRNTILPEIEKMKSLLDRVNLSESKNKEIYSINVSDSDIKGIDKIREMLVGYNSAKKEYERTIGNSVSSIVDSPSVVQEIDSKYKSDLSYIEIAFDKVGKKADGYSLNSRVIDTVMFKELIKSLPFEGVDATDTLKIQHYKESIKNNDLILLDDFNNLNKNIDSLKSYGFFNEFTGGFKNIEKNTGSYHIKKDLSSINEIVERIEKKHGIGGLPDFDAKDTFKFMEYKKLADQYKEYQKKEVKKENKLDIS